MLASLGKNAFGYYAIMFSVVHLSVHASEDARAALKSSSELGLRGLGLRFLVIQLERATERHGPLQRQAQEQGPGGQQLTSRNPTAEHRLHAPPSVRALT